MTSLDFVDNILSIAHFQKFFRLLITIVVATLVVFMIFNPNVPIYIKEVISESKDTLPKSDAVVEVYEVEKFVKPNVTLKEQSQIQNPTVSAFQRSLSDYPWSDLKLVEHSSVASLKLKPTETLIEKLIPYLVKEPLVPINLNDSCKGPPPLQSLEESYNDQPCKRTNITRKVGVLLQLGFDVDTLEIHLNELDDLVDFYFILESTRSHYKAIKKPLIWELVKTQPRFEKFADKIVHFILDDATLAHATVLQNSSDNNIFGVEDLQEKLRWMKFLDWNNETKYFTDSDLLGFGDIDEIPNREAIHRLKNCELPGDPVDIGIWFPFGSIDQAFTPYWHVRNYRLTLGDPTYWTLKTAKGHSTFPSRMRGRSDAFLLGGMHMTHYGYLPFQLMKRLTMTERDSNHDVAQLADFFDRPHFSSSIFDVELKYGRAPESLAHKIHKVQNLDPAERKEFMKKIMYFPWFYDCNRKRYPAWEQQHDTRLD